MSVTVSRLVASHILCLFRFSNHLPILSCGAEWMEEQRHLDIWNGKGDEVPVLGGDSGCSCSSQLM